MPTIFSAAVSQVLPHMRTLSTSRQFVEISQINKAFNLGFLQMICGSLAITVEIASYFTGTGIWSGCLFIVTGILGIVCQKYGYDYNAIVSFMVFSMISSFAALILLTVSCLELYPATAHRAPPFRKSPKVNIVLLVISLSELVITVKCTAAACKIVFSNLVSENVPSSPCPLPNDVASTISSVEINRDPTVPPPQHININFMWTPNINIYNFPRPTYPPPYHCSSENIAGTFFPDAPPVSIDAPPVYEELPPPYLERFNPTKGNSVTTT